MSALILLRKNVSEITGHFLYKPHTFSVNSAKLNQCYLGLLYSMEDLAVYGYITPAKLKIIVALALSDAVVRDSDIVLVNE